MGEVVGGGRRGEVEVEIVRDDVGRRDAPRLAVLGAVGSVRTAPPGGALSELLVSHGPGLRVALAACGRIDLVVPDVLRGARSIEEQQVNRDLRVWLEKTFR